MKEAKCRYCKHFLFFEQKLDQTTRSIFQTSNLYQKTRPLVHPIGFSFWWCCSKLLCSSALSVYCSWWPLTAYNGHSERIFGAISYQDFSTRFGNVSFYHVINIVHDVYKVYSHLFFDKNIPLYKEFFFAKKCNLANNFFFLSFAFLFLKGF